MKFSTTVALLGYATSVAIAADIDNAPFADDLTTDLYTDSALDNDCTSSLGVSMALSLVYPSAIGEAEEQMRTTMNYPSGQQSTLLWSDTTTSLTDRYQGRCTWENGDVCNLFEPTLAISNSVWVHDEITLDATYAAVVGDLVQQLDFTSVEAGGTINEWVNGSTNGLIDSIVEEGPLPDGWIMLAINSIYLKGSWSNQFREDRTNSDAFYSSPSRATVSADEVHFMNQVEFFDYSHDALPGFQLVKLPFDGGDGSRGLSMVLALPLKSNDDSPRMASSVDVLAAIPSLERTQVALAIPKFQFESKYEDTLKESLQTIGMTAPFEERPDVLCVADGECNAYIDVIIQKTFIDMNEKGVEAAAVTAVGISMTSMPPPNSILFQGDHPFQFFLYDEEEDVIIFEGQIRAPAIPEGSVAPLEASHDDEGFWSDTFFKEVAAPPEFTAVAVEETTPPVAETTEVPLTTDPPSGIVTTETTDASDTTTAETTDAPDTTTTETAETEAPTETSDTSTTDTASSNNGVSGAAISGLYASAGAAVTSLLIAAIMH